MKRDELAALAGSKWTGQGELWVDPLGNNAELSDCALSIDAEGLHYRWSYQGKPQEGRVSLRDRGVTWFDSWHQSKPTECAELPGAWGLFAVHYSYSGGEGPEWGWRIALSQRPTGELVLQMTNIAPWGEEARAVRMVFTRDA